MHQTERLSVLPEEIRKENKSVLLHFCHFFYPIYTLITFFIGIQNIETITENCCSENMYLKFEQIFQFIFFLVILLG